MTPYYFLAAPADRAYAGIERPPVLPPSAVTSTTWHDAIEALSTPSPWSSFYSDLAVATQLRDRLVSDGVAVVVLAVRDIRSEHDAEVAAVLPGHLGLDVATREPLSLLRYALAERTVSTSDDMLWDLLYRYAATRMDDHGLLSTYRDAAYLQDACLVLETRADSSLGLSGVRILAVQALP